MPIKKRQCSRVADQYKHYNMNLNLTLAHTQLAYHSKFILVTELEP
jgi:hypothetical protein